MTSVRNWEDGTLPRGPRIAKIAEALGANALELRDEIDAWTRASRGAAKMQRQRRVDVPKT